jgi:hypothetical protein
MRPRLNRDSLLARDLALNERKLVERIDELAVNL